MVLRMSRPTTRKGSSKYQFRKRVPERYRQALKGKKIFFELPRSHGEALRRIEVTIGAEIKFSHQTRNPVVAAEMNGVALRQVYRLFEALDAGPTALTQKELVALSGDVYRLCLYQKADVAGQSGEMAATRPHSGHSGKVSWI